MMIVAGAVFLLYAGGLSLFLRGDHAARDKAGVNWILFALFWLLATFVVMSVRDVTGTTQGGNAGGAVGLMVALVILVVGIVLAIPFWMHLLHLAADTGVKSVLVNEAHMTVEKTFDLADKAEHEKQYDAAIKLYLVAAAEAPETPEPWRRAGEAAWKNGSRDEAIDYLRRALLRTEAPEDVASLAFRVAELLDRELGKRDEARVTLEQAAGRLKGTKFEEYARDRLRSMA